MIFASTGQPCQRTGAGVAIRMVGLRTPLVAGLGSTQVPGQDGFAIRLPPPFALDPAPGDSPRKLRRTKRTTADPQKGSAKSLPLSRKLGAGEGARTLDPDLGKVVLYH